MTITEYLMRPGTASVRLERDTPTYLTNDILALIDGDGPGASMVVTQTRVDSDALTDAQMLTNAIYQGSVVARPSRLSYECVGLLAWLDTIVTTDKTETAGTIDDWLDSLRRNGITVGTTDDTGASTVTRTFPAYTATRREMLDRVAAIGGWEYRVNPDYTYDGATAENLFVSPPTVIVTKDGGGADGLYTGIKGSIIDTNFTQLGLKQLTHAYAVVDGVGGAATVGSATVSRNLLSPTGSSPFLSQVISAPAEDAVNDDAVAQAYINLRGARRKIEVAVSQDDRLSTLVEPGDEIYVYDLAGGVQDVSNPIEFRGSTIFPMTVRLLSISRQIRKGRGVYFRENSASPSYIDVSDFVEWETGDEFWTVGDWSPDTTRQYSTDPAVIELQLSS